ncbi:GAF domain-containing protein [Planktothrix sp. FACHB-1365]|uniref:GAF domain-containing protein n=1 Tax=Planktothrix sp. FACHB-1365 TaxID=2692855 RepID=UPI001688845E|nr:GAF domain-containing protein [Planktothrix sp. FACHB-1365]MBD2484972.1 GAF domain-containing protein [Planktothrix sp. FACHB-1365]
MNQALTLQTIAEQVQELLQAETVVVMLAESSGEQVYHAAAVGKYAADIVGKRGDAATSGLPGIVFKGSCPVLVENTKGDLRVRQDTAQAWGIKSALATHIPQIGVKFPTNSKKLKWV